MLGWELVVIGKIVVADNVSIAAGAVVVKSVNREGSVVIGNAGKEI